MPKRNENEKFKRCDSISSICRKISSDQSISAELKGRREIVIRGCQKINKYTPQIISVNLKFGIITICGNDLTCFAFSERSIGINGKIKCIFFTDEKKGGDKI